MSTAEKANSRMAKKEKTADEGRGKDGREGKDAKASVFDQNPQLKTALQQIEKQFGEGSIMPLGADASM